MITFAYTAKSRAGQTASGTLNATDRREARLELQRRGLVPVTLAESGAPAAAAPKTAAKATPEKARPAKPAAAVRPVEAKQDAGNARDGKDGGAVRQVRLGIRQVLLFTQELNDLIGAGMTLGHALNTLAGRDSNPAQKTIMVAVRDDIVRGSNLSDALARHARTFPAFYVSMVRAGEASGQLSDALANISRHYERLAETREKLIGALTYPVIILCIGLATMVFCMTFVIPKFAQMFSDIGQALPASTRLLIGMSGFFTQYGLILLAAAVVLVVAIRRWLQTEPGGLFRDRLLLAIPFVRAIVSANAYTHFARTLGGLMQNGVPVLRALGIVENTMGNRIISRQIASARARVTDGASISRPLEEGRVFPPLLTDMLRIGEETGDVPAALRRIAERYDGELSRSLKAFTTILEPLMMLFIAIIVGFIVASMLLAVMALSSGFDK
ncbi:MAG: type II secretion system F family protein [Kiritimatiellia bacterium]